MKSVISQAEGEVTYLMFAIVAVLFLTSCSGVNAVQVMNLPNKQYKIQVNRSPFIPQDDVFGVPLTTQEEEFKKKAQEVCPNYKIIDSESAIGLSQGSTRTWVIECLQK